MNIFTTVNKLYYCTYTCMYVNNDHISLFGTFLYKTSLSLSLLQLEQFFVDTIQTAYLADGLNWSHPIIQEVSDPDEINGLFDSISYDKVQCTCTPTCTCTCGGFC